MFCFWHAKHNKIASAMKITIWLYKYVWYAVLCFVSYFWIFMYCLRRQSKQNVKHQVVQARNGFVVCFVFSTSSSSPIACCRWTLMSLYWCVSLNMKINIETLQQTMQRDKIYYCFDFALNLISSFSPKCNKLNLIFIRHIQYEKDYKYKNWMSLQ